MPKPNQQPASNKFSFDDVELKAALDIWSKRQLEKNPELVGQHIDYMTGSVYLFLYSEEAEPLRGEK